MNQYNVKIESDTFGGAFTKATKYYIVVETPSHDVWHQGNTERVPGERNYITRDGSSSNYKEDAAQFESYTEALDFGEEQSKPTKEYKDTNVYLLLHKNSVFAQ